MSACIPELFGGIPTDISNTSSAAAALGGAKSLLSTIVRDDGRPIKGCTKKGVTAGIKEARRIVSFILVHAVLLEMMNTVEFINQHLIAITVSTKKLNVFGISSSSDCRINDVVESTIERVQNATH